MLRLNFEMDDKEVQIDIPRESIDFYSAGYATMNAAKRNMLTLFMKSGKVIVVRCFIMTEKDRVEDCAHVDSADYIVRFLRSDCNPADFRVIDVAVS